MYPHPQDYEERINSSTEAERAAKEVATREAATEADKAKAAEAAARAAKAASWDPEETRLLEKALVKFPVVRPPRSYGWIGLRERALPPSPRYDGGFMPESPVYAT